MKLLRYTAALLIGLAATSLRVAAPTEASHVSCGDVLTSHTVLDSDLNCAGNGLIMGADGISLDLNGHTITSAGGLVGVQAWGRSGVTIRNGTVTGFLFGVWLDGTRNSSIRGVAANGNKQTGILVTNDSDGNQVTGCTANGNGAAGIIVHAGSDRNSVKGCTASGNGIGTAGLGIEVSLGSTGNDVKENQVVANKRNGLVLLNGANRNEVKNNTVAGNGRIGLVVQLNSLTNNIKDNVITGNKRNGIVVQDNSDGNVIRNNVINHNGTSGALDGNQGIVVTLGAGHTDIRDNTINGNLRNGISVNADSSGNNTVISNSLSGNGDGVTGFNLSDLTTGPGTAGTNDTYKNNSCLTSNPLGLCSAP